MSQIMMIILFYLAGCKARERETYADGYIDEVVDTRYMRQVEDTDEWRGSGSPFRGEEQEFIIVWQVEADEQQA